ncbi:MAG: hypothetical protein IKU33_06350 [Bacteroidales bacterium]|nr:hypothetical protein [Bacteroidales bacterium]
MKRNFRYIAAIVLATSFFSCTEFEEFHNGEAYVPAPGETVKLTLSADKGGSNVGADTRVYVGQIVGNKVRYYWNEEDQIGVIPFLDDAKPNYVTKETQINQGDKNLAQFEAYITAEGYNDSAANLLIYYPYNSSMLEGTTGNSGQEYASAGLTFRLPQIQEQYGYSMDFVGEGENEISKHPSAWAISHYGLAYDLAASAISTETEGGQTIANATGEFQLDHANTYFQFNVYGSESDTPGKHYGDNSWKIAALTLEAGHCEIATDEITGETVYTLTDQVPVAGTFKFKYDYNVNDFANVQGNNGNSNIKLTSVAPANSVRVNMNSIEAAPALGDTPETAVPAFAVINSMGIKENSKGTLNCLKVSVTCYHYDENGNIDGSDTRSRYYNISDIVGQDLSGNYYTIDFEVCDPVESYTDLSVSNTSNCYLIGAPGNYTFNATVAGNAKLPYGMTGTSLGIDPKNLLSKGKENYGLDWLWASGLSFDNVDDGIMSDAEVVQKILNNVELSGEDGHISIGLAAGSTMKTLSGNILIALYEKNADGTAGDIVWTWHLWLGQPETQHYHFPATNSSWVYTNEDWYMMDRNLGAETTELGNPRSTGLFYQRSRKEPMIGFGNRTGSTDWTNNQIPTYRNTDVFGTRAAWTAGMNYSNYNTLKYPMALIENIPSQTSTGAYYYGWSSSKSDVNDIANDTKSMFDPCPSGYRMPTVREWDNLKADVYYYIQNGVGSGALGYCHWQEVPSIMVDPNDERNIDIAARIAGGDYYTVNDNYEREYHITRHSGTGQTLVTRFPNTGLLRGNGEWVYMSDNSYTTPIEIVEHPDGPEVSASISMSGNDVVAAPQIIVDWKNDKKATSGTVTFETNKTYYYTLDSSNEEPQSTVTGGTITIYATDGSSNSTNIYIGSIDKGASKTIYFYNKENGKFSEPSTLTVSVAGNNEKYSANAINGSTPSVQYTLNVTFADPAGIYSYSTSSNGATTPINGTTWTVNCSSIQYTGYNDSAILYFYQTTDKGISAPTTVTIYRSGSNGNYSYTAVASDPGAGYTEEVGGETIVSSTSTMALWTSGRIDEGTFYTYWFGPGNDKGDGWGEYKKDANGTTTVNRNDHAPYTESRKTYGFTYSPVQLKVYDSNSPEWNTDPALPIRCIREYDNASTQVLAE